jgi:hypothetical protein
LQAASAKGFAAFFNEAEWVKIQKYRIKTGKNGKKTCGNGPFAVDKVCEKTQGKRRWVFFRTRMDTGFPRNCAGNPHNGGG